MNQVIILLTDDDADDRFFLRQALENNIEKVVIHEAENGVDALQWLDQQDKDFSLVLLDINMPVMNGIEVLEQIRSRGRVRHIPIVILSTSDNRDQIEKAYQKGANSYITKPGSILEYSDIVQAIKTCFLKAR